jgi:hypothetical protein
MGLMARVESRKTRSDKQRDSSRWLNTEVKDFCLSTRMGRRFTATPTQAVVIVATPEHQKNTECCEGWQKLR